MKLHGRMRAGWLVPPLLLAAVNCAAQRKVFAHYMLANQDYVADAAGSEAVIASYEREIKQAQEIGVDGFALNAGGWFQEPRYIRRASEMFEAAYRLHSGFKLLFSADMCCSNDAADVEDMVRRFANHPRYAPLYFKKNGKFVLTTFAGEKQGAGFWRQLRTDLEEGKNPSTHAASGALAPASGVPSSAPLPIYLVPAFFWGGELPHDGDIQAGLAEYAPFIEGALYWGIAGVPGLGHAPDQVPSSDAYASVLHAAHKSYMAPICFQFWGANAGRYYEYGGYAGMRAMWMDAINLSHPEWVEIITWNDFVEGTYVSPIDDPARYDGANDLGASVAPPGALRFFPSHRGAAEFLRYYIRWYKNGKRPPLRQDSVFWAYHTQLAGQKPYATQMKVYGPLADVIYLTAELKAPAVLQVSVGDQVSSLILAAGSHDVQVPLIAGTAPHFELIRAGKRVVTGDGNAGIVVAGAYPNLYYSTGFLSSIESTVR